MSAFVPEAPCPHDNRFLLQRMSRTGLTRPAEGIDIEQLEIDLMKQALVQSNGNKSEVERRSA